MAETLASEISWLQRHNGRKAAKLPVATKADGVAVYAPDGRMLYANDAAAQMCGLASGRQLSRTSTSELSTLLDLYDESGNSLDLGTLIDDSIWGTVPPNRAIRFRVRLTGEERWCRLKAERILDEDGALTMVVSIATDITETRMRRAIR